MKANPEKFCGGPRSGPEIFYGHQASITNSQAALISRARALDRRSSANDVDNRQSDHRFRASVEHRDQLRSAIQMKIASIGMLPASVRLVSCISLFDGAVLVKRSDLQ